MWCDQPQHQPHFKNSRRQVSCDVAQIEDATVPRQRNSTAKNNRWRNGFSTPLNCVDTESLNNKVLACVLLAPNSARERR